MIVADVRSMPEGFVPSIEEIRHALFNMKPLKAPRPDGFILAFFKRFGILLGVMYVKTFKNGSGSNVFLSPRVRPLSVSYRNKHLPPSHWLQHNLTLN